MLPYSREVLYSLFGELNTSFTILQIIGGIVYVGAFGCLAFSRSRLAFALLTVLWFGCAICWYFKTFAPINFLAPVYGAMALAQGAGLLVACAFKPSLCPRKALLTIFGGSVVILSLIDLFEGPGWPLTRLPGLHPEPLILLTTMIAATVSRRALGAALVVIPLLLAAVSGYESYVLEMPQSYLVPIGAFFGAIGLLLPRKPPRNDSFESTSDCA